MMYKKSKEKSKAGSKKCPKCGKMMTKNHKCK